MDVIVSRASYTHTMSKRLQVLLSDKEMQDIQHLARRERITVGKWVRRVLRQARVAQPRSDPETKLKAVRRAVSYAFPTTDIQTMIEEIERGYEA